MAFDQRQAAPFFRMGHPGQHQPYPSAAPMGPGMVGPSSSMSGSSGTSSSTVAACSVSPGVSTSSPPMSTSPGTSSNAKSRKHHEKIIGILFHTNVRRMDINYDIQF